jgi:hypothetical protein
MRFTILHSLFLAPSLTLAVACGGGDDTDDTMTGSTAAPSGGTATTTTGGTAMDSTATGGDASPWTGRTFLLTVPENNWISPEGIGPEIGPHVPSFMMMVNSGTSSSVEVTVTSADATGAQEMCTPTTMAPTTAGPYPDVQIGPFDFPVHLKTQDGSVHVNATIMGMTMKNVLPGAEPAEDGEVVATLDMREIWPMFTILMAENGDDVCTALESFGAPCQACPSDSQVYCLTIEAILLGATEVSAPVTPVDAATLPATCAGASDG